MKKSFILSALLVLAGCLLAPPARAQFIGFTSPQTVQQTLTTNLPCTGAAQIFPVTNLGQTQHFISINSSGSITSLQGIIQGIDTQGNVFTISDVAGIGGNTTASGYFPIVRVQITCLPAVTGTFTLSYSGASSTPNVTAGSYLSSQVDKFLFRGVAANVNQNISFQSPYGSSSGTLVFQYTGASIGGSSVTVFCTGSTTIGSFTNFVFSPANDTFAQTFNVPASTCPQVQVSYTSGGVASNLNLEYIFDPPGQLQGSNQQNPCYVGPTGLGTIQPVTVGANTTVRIVAPFSDHRISVCALLVTVGVAGTIQLTEGTGATCGTGTTNLSGAMTMAVGTPLPPTGGPSFMTTLKANDALCLTTAGGATAGGLISFNYVP